MKPSRSNMTFRKCDTCGQVIGIIKNKDNQIVCCGKVMSEIVPQETEDFLGEKHIPIFFIKHKKLFIQVGSNEHPTSLDHHIEWVAVKTNVRHQRIPLFPGERARIMIPLVCGEEVLEIYAYCNIHGLWKRNVDSDPKGYKCKSK